ncbi:Uncharacterised protein [Clostridioides difficile]|nr:Uncharacterised protein [Clostridioides difficile]
MSKMKEFQKTASGKIKLDWNSVEEEIGFKLHDNLKDFYSRILGFGENGQGEMILGIEHMWAKFLLTWGKYHFFSIMIQGNLNG